MPPKRLTDALLVCGQISVQDVDRFAEAGVRLILNNRPDGEKPGQPTSDELRARAEAKGVAWRHIPVSGGRFDDAAGAAFVAATGEAPGEVLAFCRSGTRATTLWALSQAGRKPPAEILEVAQRAGYDLS